MDEALDRGVVRTDALLTPRPPHRDAALSAHGRPRPPPSADYLPTRPSARSGASLRCLVREYAVRVQIIFGVVFAIALHLFLSSLAVDLISPLFAAAARQRVPPPLPPPPRPRPAPAPICSAHICTSSGARRSVAVRLFPLYGWIALLPYEYPSTALPSSTPTAS